MRAVPDETFAITYDGPALATNRMDVRQLAPALLSLADVVQAAHGIVAPLAAPPGLQITATEVGSFSVELLLQDVADGAVDFLTAPGMEAFSNAAGVTGLGLVGLIGAAIRLRKKRQASRPVGDPLPLGNVRPGWVRVSFEDRTTLEVPSSALRLADDLAFRRAMSGVVEPLRNPGVDDLAITQAERRVTHIDQDDLPAFAEPVVDEELLSDSTRDAVLRLLNIAFVPGHKWKVSDGSRDFWVTIEDLTFIQRVETNMEAFRSGDELRCEVRTQQWRKPNGELRTDESIVRVTEHVPGPRAAPLPFPDEGPGAAPT